MRASTAYIIVAAAAVFATATGGSASRTVNDVKQCFRDNIAEYLKTCKSKLPAGKRAALRKCIKADAAQGFQNATADCLANKGIKDADDCYNMEPPPEQLAQHKRYFREFPVINLPFETIVKLKPFQECATAVLANKDDCTKGCAEGDDKAAEAWYDCVKKAEPKEGERHALTECVKAALA